MILDNNSQYLIKKDEKIIVIKNSNLLNFMRKNI